MYWTNYAEERILRAFLGTTATAPANLYAACFLSSPGEAGAGTEISYPGYQRLPISFSQPASDSSGGVAITNTADVGFETSTLAAGTITHCGLMDSQVGGNMWAYVTLDEPIEVSAGVAPLIQAQEWRYVSHGNFSAAFKTRTLNLLRGINLAGIAPHIALYNGDPDSGGAELTGSNYARFAVAFTSPAVQSAGQSMIQNTALVSSPRSADNWGTWSHTVIMSALSGGEAVAFEERTPPILMGRGKAAFIQPGQLSVSVN